jgi:hypothetical protein
MGLRRCQTFNQLHLPGVIHGVASDAEHAIEALGVSERGNRWARRDIGNEVGQLLLL